MIHHNYNASVAPLVLTVVLSKMEFYQSAVALLEILLIQLTEFAIKLVLLPNIMILAIKHA